ncbi:EAL domain-containing protein [Henriciella sp.]|uniref:bifunctional diguanylate cyclase/phosphodiesterase n=1 Tax=Henriciella sp. TaxID=1968823 RepID=UPI00260B0755|nr:EAL domain-containing protein [Henriciella sp.]
MIVYQRGILARTSVRQRVWAGLSGTVTAIGIWATHFVAMLGYRPGFAVHFDGVTTLLSVLIAISGFLVTSQVLIGGMTLLRRLACAGLATATVSAMHYYGAGALKAAALIEFDPAYVTASVVAAFAFFTLAYASFSTSSRRSNVIAFTGSLAAVASLHFIGMTAMDVVPMAGFDSVAWSIAPAMLGTWVVFGVVLILVTASLAAGLDSVLSKFRFREARRMSLLVNAASEALFVTRADGEVIELNDAARQLFDTSHGDLCGTNINMLLGADITTAWQAGRYGLSEHHMALGEEKVPVDISIRSLEDEGEGLFAVSLYDLRERLRNEANIRKLAYSDPLTGLPNRAAFQKALDGLWDGALRDASRFSVILADLDEFKDINDQFGHGAGDAVLKASAIRLRETFGANALVSRLGGDEFAILLPYGDDETTLMKLADSCVKKLSEGIVHEDIMIQSGVSVGLAVAHSHDGVTDPDSLLKAADRALYSAKKNGRRTARLYDAELHESSEKKRSMEADLVRAVRDKEFVLHYQAKVSSTTRRVLGYEALIRWERPGHGLVMPGEFIETAEQSLVIQDIGRWCLYEACHAAAGWKDDVSISVNLSARQFMDPNLYATVRDAVETSGLEPGRLELEITETALIHNTMVAGRILEQLKTLGVQVALDDFGTGYSSMRFVQQFPFDRIKIDRSFVMSMDTDRKAFAVVDAILRLGKSLSIPVVAEGVETEAQAISLIRSQCTELQGFLISRPGPLTPEGQIAAEAIRAVASLDVMNA